MGITAAISISSFDLSPIYTQSMYDIRHSYAIFISTSNSCGTGPGSMLFIEEYNFIWWWSLAHLVHSDRSEDNFKPGNLSLQVIHSLNFSSVICLWNYHIIGCACNLLSCDSCCLVSLWWSSSCCCLLSLCFSVSIDRISLWWCWSCSCLASLCSSVSYSRICLWWSRSCCCLFSLCSSVFL